MKNIKKTFKKIASAVEGMRMETFILLRELAKCFVIFCTEGWGLTRADKYQQCTLEKRKHFLPMK